MPGDGIAETSLNGLSISPAADSPVGSTNSLAAAGGKSDDTRVTTRSVRFVVQAETRFGERIRLVCNHGASAYSETGVELVCERDGRWGAEIVVSPHQDIEYMYARVGVDGELVYEHGGYRTAKIDEGVLVSELLFLDVFRDSPCIERDVFGSSAFRSVVFRRDEVVAGENAPFQDARNEAAATKALILGMGAFVARFEVFAERVAKDDEICVVGTADGIGASQVENAVKMFETDGASWSVCVAFPKHVLESGVLSFWYVIRNKITKVVRLQEIEKRSVTLEKSELDFLANNDGDPRSVKVVNFPSEKVFQYPRRWKGAGIALPVFSIRSKESCGVGEFNDIPKVVDLCVATGHKLLQLLPVNDTTSNNDWRDSYPYSAVSSFALHPQYINLQSLGKMPNDMLKEYCQERDTLNALKDIDYIRMMKVKMRFLKRFYAMEKADFLQSKEFVAWFKENQNWLVPYALFRFFMEVNGGPNFDEWGARKFMTTQEMQEMAAPDSFHFDYLGLVYYTQFHLHKQLTKASQYAAEHEVVLKGDLPIGVNRYCADTWVNPHLFRLDMQAGAPPDYFSEYGQNWYFPTYDWEAMSKDNYAWWRARLGHMSKYFHAYRIDHILGFFRIWEIPGGARTGMSGRFFPAHALSRQELESRGLWDIDRFCFPYVHDGLLQEMFKDNWWKIKDRFFDALYSDRLKFKKDFDTERKVEAVLDLPEDAPEGERKYNEFVKNMLFQLFNNVCLLRDRVDPDLFHPRYELYKTRSYNDLRSEEWKSVLHELHDDYFFKRQDELWRKSAMDKLPMMKAASNMLVCGEDLGLLPSSVPYVMRETSILSLAVQRMPAGDTEFGIPSEYKYECVATTSSHDVSTFRGWWQELTDEGRYRYWTQVMQRHGRSSIPRWCSTDIIEWAISDHLACPAMWVIFPIQDLLGMDQEIRRPEASEEQINDPSNPRHQWKFRLHLDTDAILAKRDLVAKMATLNERYGRNRPY